MLIRLPLMLVIGMLNYRLWYSSGCPTAPCCPYIMSLLPRILSCLLPCMLSNPLILVRSLSCSYIPLFFQWKVQQNLSENFNYILKATDIKFEKSIGATIRRKTMISIRFNRLPNWITWNSNNLEPIRTKLTFFG